MTDTRANFEAIQAQIDQTGQQALKVQMLRQLLSILDPQANQKPLTPRAVLERLAIVIDRELQALGE